MNKKELQMWQSYQLTKLVFMTNDRFIYIII